MALRIPSNRAALLAAAFLALAACSDRRPAADAGVAVAAPRAHLLSPVLSVDWESGLPGGWTAATSLGTCTWHVVNDPQTLKVASDLNPDSVTLPDSGAHLPAKGGTHVVWFGEDTTGTFIGTPYTAGSKNGGLSKAVQAGTLTSPAFSLAGVSKAAVEFDSWWEIEGVAGQNFDMMVVEVSSDGTTWNEAGRLNPTFATAAASDVGYTAGGSGAAPEWRHYAYDISSYAGQPSVRLRFSFDTRDEQYNGFRGWTIDNVSVGGGDSLPAPTLTTVSPAVGTGNDLISIAGTHFVQGAKFYLGATEIPAPSIMQFGTDYMVFQVPSGLTSGAHYDVKVVNPDTQQATLAGAFTYSSTASPTLDDVSPATGSVGVPKGVTLSGSNFAEGATVDVGAFAATSVVVVDEGTITATFPAMPSGNYNVTVTNSSGQAGVKFAAYSIPVVVDASTVTVTAPNGGESWNAGTTHAITWTQTGVTTARIDLYKGGSFDQTIATGVSAAAGTYSWAIPPGLAGGTDYTVKVSNQLGVNGDYGDASFTVTAPASGTSISASGGTTTYTAPGAAVAVDPGLTVTGASTLGSAKVAISSGFVAGQDVLSFTDQNGITGSYNATTGILTLTGTTSAANYQAALASVKYANGAGNTATPGQRQITFSLGSGLYYAGTGHFYEFVAAPGVAWTDAITAASARAYFGLQGYLVTVTSAGENAFIQGKLSGQGWMGASTPIFTVPRTWSWVTGPEAGTPFFTQSTQDPAPGSGTAIGGAYGNWASGEPNNWGGIENYAHFYIDGSWNDYPDTGGDIAGYVVEYGGMAGDPVVTLSSTKALQVDGPYAIIFQTDGTSGASITGTSPQYVQPGGNAGAVTANAPVGYHFVNWTGTSGFVTTTSNPLTVTGVSASMTVTAHFQASVCGNGVKESGEQCDDGNAVPADGCSATCRLEPGYTCPTAGAACAPVYGDGILTAAEQCDDGNGTAGDGCDTSGHTEPGYACFFTTPNLVQNGSFDAGATGWTSGYAWSDPATPNAIYDEGTWSVNGDGHQLHDAIASGFPDAEGSASNEAAYFNGASTAIDALTQSVTLTAGKTYVLSMYVTNWGGAGDSPYPKLSIRVGGQLLTTDRTLSTSSWVRVGGTFVAASTGPATIKVTDSITAASGNDFAVDGVVLREAAPQTCGMVCDLDADCAAAGPGYWCDTTAVGHPAFCTAPLPPGTPIPTIPNRDPSDPTIDGTCTPENAATVCADGVCNATTGTCASVSGACVDGSECASNVCAATACIPQYTVRFLTDGTAGAILTGETTQAVLSGDGATAVTAVAPAAHNFSGWTGPAGFTSAANPLVLSGVSGDLALTAHFAGVGSLTLSSGGGQSTAVGEAYAAQLCVAVRDTAGAALAGAPVHLTVPGSGASAALTADLTSGGGGLACTSVTANHVAGAFSISASSGAVTASPIATLTNVSGAPTTWSYAHGAASEQSATVGEAFALPLSVLVRDAFGNPVPGVTVIFTHHDDGGTGYATTLSAGSASTGSDGIAEVTASASHVAGWESLDVSFGGLDPAAAFRLEATPDVPATLTVDPRSSPQTAQVGGTTFATPLGLTVTDRWGNAVPGATVAFDAPTSGPRAALSAATPTTDATGHAQVLASAGDGAGTYAVTASVGSLRATFALTNALGPPGSIAILDGDGQRTSVDGTFAAPLVVEVMDSFANPVPGVLVSFQLSSAAASATLSASALVTGDDGRATLTVTPDTVAGSFQVVASAQGVASPAVFSLVLDPGAPAAVTASPTSSNQTAQVATAFQNALAVVVRDSHGNPVPGVEVTFAGPGGAGAGAALSAGAATTGEGGVASVLATANDVSGRYELTATVEGVSTPARFALANQPDVPNALTTTSGTPQEAVVDAAFAPLAVVIRDRFGNPVPGVEVTFQSPGSGPSAVLDATTATTDADGVARATARAGTESGAYEIVASAAGITAPGVFKLVNLQGAEAGLDASPSSQDQSTRVGDPFASPLTLTVVDVHGNPVPGVSVHFSCPATGPTCALDTATALTDASGRATVHVSAGNLPGTVDVVAAVEGLTPVTFHLHNLVGLPGAIASTGGASQEAGVLTAYAEALEVQVNDALGNPVPGVEITFEVVSDGPQSVTLSAASRATDGAGKASVTATANASRGTVVVRATAPGVAAPVQFTLTNTAVATTLSLDIQLPVFGTVISETGITHLRAVVGPSAGGATPTGTVTFRASRTIELVPGQAGVTQEGDAILATLVGGVVDVQVKVIGWRSRTLEATYTPDEPGALTWAPATKTVDLVADVPDQSHGGGGCSTGPGGAAALTAVPLLLLALRPRRRRD